MPEEIVTGKEEVAGDAGQQTTGNKDVPADGQQGTTQDAAESQNTEAGLRAAAVAERVKRQDAETKAANAEATIEQMKQTINAQPAPVQPTSLYMQAAKFHGFDPEYMTPAETGQVMETLLQFMAANQQNAVFESSHSDYKDIVGSVIGGKFIESPHLLKVYDSNPGLREAFQSLGASHNTKLIAYQMVKNSPEYQATLKTESMTEEQKAAAEAEVKIKAANTAASISSVQGGGNLDRRAALVGMSDAEFKVELEKKKAEAT